MNDDLKGISSNKMIEQGLATWKEQIAYVLSHGSQKERISLCDHLGEELLKVKKDPNAAIICYLMADNCAVVIDLW